ncbi:MAG: UDP-N-acetylmuramoyl-tripeptide--D-alanyl-D-alanine ligase [Candidatus Sericytochromatia bacterium]|nr:MAG: UDP-N-acetylmuramoyl-tripeptide--D-alanyl-D-alanine ligase [Candidatus Sericytochromatia bacterium]
MLNKGISLKEIINITNGIGFDICDKSVFNISTDTRTINKGDLFIPIKGENFDGHDFINQAFEKGAIASLCNKDKDIKLKNVIFVNDTLKAYQEIAKYILRKVNPKVIGITGSSGKTSTKELAYSLFKNYFKTLKTEGNFNNQIGLPYTLTKLNEEHEITILEMGMRGLNQIKELTEIAPPNYGIITGIGTAHIEILGSQENIAIAKWELAQAIQANNGYLAIPYYDKFLLKLSESFKDKNKLFFINLQKDEHSSIYLINSWVEENKQYFTFKNRISDRKHIAFMSVLGQHQISNALLVIAISNAFEISLPNTIDLTFENLFGRNEYIKVSNSLIVNDSYNANPESMKAGIKTFLENNKDSKNILVLGEMKELGNFSKDLHKEIGLFCSKFSNIEKLIVVGENAKYILDGYSKDNYIFFDKKEDCINFLNNLLDKSYNIYFKASRGAKLEDIINNLGVKNGK